MVSEVKRERVAAPRRATYQQLDLLQELRREARHDLILGVPQAQRSQVAAHHSVAGSIRAALLIGRVQTPHRFRSKRQFWAYCGLALETRSSADYGFVNGQLGTEEEAGVHPRIKPQPQPRSKEPV